MIRTVIYAAFGTSFTVATAWAFGALILRRVRFPLYRLEERLLAFILGSACLSAVVFVLCEAHLARKGIFLALGALMILAAFGTGAHRTQGRAFPPLNRKLGLFFVIAFCLLTAAHMFIVMPPQFAPDILTYRLSLIGHAQTFAGDNPVPSGVELLFLFAFIISRYSAAVLLNLGFVIALAALGLCYGRRIGYPVAGAAGAILMYLSTLRGEHQSLAYTHVGIGRRFLASFASCT